MALGLRHGGIYRYLDTAYFAIEEEDLSFTLTRLDGSGADDEPSYVVVDGTVYDTGGMVLGPSSTLLTDTDDTYLTD